MLDDYTPDTGNTGNTVRRRFTGRFRQHFKQDLRKVSAQHTVYVGYRPASHKYCLATQSQVSPYF